MIDEKKTVCIERKVDGLCESIIARQTPKQLGEMVEEWLQEPQIRPTTLDISAAL